MPLLLFVAFVVVPLIEIALIARVGAVLGLLPTLALLLGISVAGAVLVRREGSAAWRRFRTALAESRMPGEEVVDGALVLVGGTLLLTPGFLTDVLGLLLVVPWSRRPVNRALRGRASARFGLAGRGLSGLAGMAGAARERRAREDGPVVDVVEIVREPGPDPEDAP